MGGEGFKEDLEVGGVGRTAVLLMKSHADLFRLTGYDLTVIIFGIYFGGFTGFASILEVSSAILRNL